MINRVILVGRLGQKPELKRAGSTTVANVSLACQNFGAKQVTWVPVTLWGKTADFAAAKLDKGAVVYIEGFLVVDEWEKDGQKRKQMKVSAQKLQVLVWPSGKADATNAEAGNTEITDEDIPF